MKRLWLFVALGISTAAGCGSGPPPSGDDDNIQLSPEVMAQMDALIREKAARSPAQAKIASSLLYARSGQFAAVLDHIKNQTTTAPSMIKRDDQGRALIDLRLTGDTSALASTVEALGGTVVDQRPRSARIYLPLDGMEALAGQPMVLQIAAARMATTSPISPPGLTKLNASRAQRVAAVQAAEAAQPVWRTAQASQARTTPGVTAGSVVSEGDRAEAVDHARNFYGVDGTGMKVGVLSDSDDFKEDAIATGDLPRNTTTVTGQDGRPGTGEGTAMMEIVHDLAPGADLFFATANSGPEAFADNIRTLRFQFHCDVIIDDAIYFIESPYEDDIIAQAVNDVTADGALYFSSAGNQGNFDDGTSGTWEGDFKPAGALATLPSGYTVHTWGDGVIGNRLEGSGNPLILHWADPGTLDNPASANDYDLFVLDHDMRNVLAASTDIQDGSGLPFEALDVPIDTVFAPRIVIAAHPSAQVRALRTVFFGGQLAIATAGSSYGHNAAAAAFSVAAVNQGEASGGEFKGGQTTDVELFVSDGPRRIFFNSDNTPANPANPGQTFASRGGITRAKPDLAATDGVSTTLDPFTGLNPFFGTSAAAPHAGAIGALLKAAVPTATPAKIRQALLAGSLDVAETGTDRNSGRGVLSAFAAMQRLGAKPAVGLTLGAVAITPLDTDVVIPDGTGQLSVQLNNIGGAAATSVQATLSSSSADVVILQGSSSYASIAPESPGGVNATPFAFFVKPSAACGALLPFTLTVSFAGNGASPVAFQLTVPTGRPAAPTNFPYVGDPQIIFDSDFQGIDVPINVAGLTPSTAKVVFRIDGTACTADSGATTVGVTHNFVSDLTFRLTSPLGKTVVLFFSPGGGSNGGHNFCQTFLDDAAATSIEDITADQAPFTGSFRPAEPLASFVGDDPNGTWTLNAADLIPGDQGTLRAVSLDVSGFSCTR